MVPIGRIISLGLLVAALGLGAASQEPKTRDPSQHRPESTIKIDTKAQAEKPAAKPPTAVTQPAPQASIGDPSSQRHDADHKGEGPKWTDAVQAVSAGIVMLFTLALTIVAILQHKMESALAADADQQRADVKASIAEATRAATAMEIMAKASQQSAEAAAKHVAISDDAARKQLRAYVGAQAINYTFNRENGAFTVCVEIKNFGQTSAFNFRLLGSLNYIDFPIKDPPNIGPCFDETHTLFPTMITYVTSNLPASEERIMHLRSGRGGFLSTVLLEYTDHQGTMHSETIRSYVTGNPALDRFGATHTATMTFWRGEST